MSDPINHPAHYTHGGIETIDVIEKWELPFHLANVVKYISRAGRKDPTKVLEDLRKARWYLDRHIAKIEAPATGPIKRQDPAVAEFRLMQGLAQLAARESSVDAARDQFLDPDPDITSDSWWQRHPLGSPERVQAVEEHRAATAVKP